LKIKIYYIGKDSKNKFSEIEQLYLSRLKHYNKVEVNSLLPVKNASKLNLNDLRKKEESLYSKVITAQDTVFLLDENGKSYDSIAFSNQLQVQLNKGTKNLCFLIGGAFGFSNEFKTKFNNSISLSKLTFPHHLARILLLEQIYRGFSILKNEPYHNQ